MGAGAETGAENGVDDTLSAGATKTVEGVSADFGAAGTGRLGVAPEPNENGAKLGGEDFASEVAALFATMLEGRTELAE